MKTKPAMKITTTILTGALAASMAVAQSPSIIQNTRNTMNAVSNHAAAATSEALSSVQPAAAASSAVHAPSKGEVVVGPAKSASHAKRPAVVVGHAVQPKAAVTATVPKPKEPVAASVGGSASPENEVSEQSVVPDSKYNANGRRDPFISPVVSHAGGSGCSTGKKCLEIGGIALRGVVRSDNGFIAVVSNGLNKAYFLRENDPVFNGYVVKITGDSIVFQETLQDRLGKTFTREVVKKITTPAV